MTECERDELLKRVNRDIKHGKVILTVEVVFVVAYAIIMFISFFEQEYVNSFFCLCYCCLMIMFIVSLQDSLEGLQETKYRLEFYGEIMGWDE